MKERRYPFSLFLIGFITNILFHFFWLFIPSVILLIVGIWVDWCLYAGLALLGIDIILSFVEQLKIRQTMLSDSDNEQFSQFQDAVSRDGNVFENIKSFVENAHKMGIRVNPWTVDGVFTIDRLLKIGCDGIITDLPDVVGGMRERYIED